MSNLCIPFPFLFVNMYMENGKCWSLFTSSQNETKVINKFLIRVESKTRKKELHDFDSNSNNRCCSILFIKKTFYSERQETSIRTWISTKTPRGKELLARNPRTGAVVAPWNASTLLYTLHHALLPSPRRDIDPPPPILFIPRVFNPSNYATP